MRIIAKIKNNSPKNGYYLLEHWTPDIYPAVKTS